MPLAIPTEIKPEVDQIVEAILYLYTESRRLTKELARSVDLTGPQLTVLKMLEGVGDLSLSELSERIRAQNSTVTGIIDRMERESLVVRARSSEDKRVIFIKLTEKGARIAREIAVEPMVVLREALSALSMQEMRDLLKILMKIARRVQSIVKRESAGNDGYVSGRTASVRVDDSHLGGRTPGRADDGHTGGRTPGRADDGHTGGRTPGRATDSKE